MDIFPVSFSSLVSHAATAALPAREVAGVSVFQGSVVDPDLHRAGFTVVPGVVRYE